MEINSTIKLLGTPVIKSTEKEKPKYLLMFRDKNGSFIQDARVHDDYKFSRRTFIV